MTLAGGVPWSQWAFCHIINRWAVGPLFLLGHSLPHRPEGPPLGSLCPPHAAGPATRPERRECGQPHPCSRLEPSPGRWPHLLPPHLTRRECLRRARQKQPSPPPPTHGGEDDSWRAVPPKPTALPPPVVPGGWRALGVRPTLSPEQEAGGRRGSGRGSHLLPSSGLRAPTTCLWGLAVGGHAPRCPTAPLTSTRPRLWLAPPCSLCSPTCGSWRCPV